ncbi:MAG: hypothetical protein IH590_00300 [Aquamicrobium sp.]|nr:hypothetical protein [Aquamicrobium sp.]
MMTFGFLVLVFGCALVLLSAFAEANHSTGRDRTTSESMRDGFVLVAIGAAIILLSWALG